ncbi:MAG: hypothetical protein Q9175_007817 [Cornicularia normoerica]
MTLLPGAFGTKVRVSLRKAVLSKSVVPEYEALSYTWGSAADLDYIYIQEAEGESVLAITQNLAEALQYLRYEDTSRVLWIDAICVDQSNISERGHQVVRMAEIYPRARRVLVWLGAECDDSALAIRELNALGSTIEVDWGVPQIKPLSGENYEQWSKGPLPFIEDQRILASIEYLLDRSWFKRLWIWQEIRLAKFGAEIICGRRQISWDKFRNAVMCLDRKYKRLSFNLFNGLVRAFNICDYDQALMSLWELLDLTRDAQCSDGRDKVYAVLNLIDGFLELEPDYSKTTEDVFKSVVLRYASMLEDLTTLSHCEMRENKETRVPSWVPDWTTPRECVRIYGSRACLEAKAQARCERENDLVVSGCLVATLDFVEQFPPITSFPSSTAQMCKIVGNLMRGKKENDFYVASGSMIDAVCRTLCCNHFAERYLPLQPDFPLFHESNEYMRNLIEHRDLIEYRSYVDEVNRNARGRAYFMARNGYIGLGPSSIKPGDQACVILGCPSPLILRPTDTTSYNVVGECYIDGFMEGEALLGALPSNVRYAYRYFPDLCRRYDALINIQTGDIQIEDPRLGPLPTGWRIADHRKRHAYNIFSNEGLGVHNTEFDPRLSPEALKARGVKLQDIRLV